MLYILFILALLIIFTFLIFYVPDIELSGTSSIETFIGENKEEDMEIDELTSECYDKIIKRGGMYYLFQSKSPLQEKINPVVFTSLDDYANYVRKTSLVVGYDCPMLEYTGNDNSFIHPDERLQPLKEDSYSSISPSVNNEAVDSQEYDEYGTPIMKPYTKTQINSLDDYEYNMVFGEGNKGGIKEQQERDLKMKNLHMDAKLNQKYAYNKDYDDKVSSLIGKPNSEYSMSNVRLTQQQEIQEEQKTANNGPQEFNKLVEDDPEVIKQMILEKNPQYSDVKIERTGINQYRVVEITPKREEKISVDVLSNRPDESAIIPEDIRTYGNSPVDPNSTGIKYMGNNIVNKNLLEGSVERMFAPSIAREVWYQSAK